MSTETSNDLAAIEAHYRAHLERLTSGSTHYDGCWKDHYPCAILALLDLAHRRADETSAPLSDEALRVIWRMHGGEFHGPNVETGTMPEATLLPLLRSLIKARPLPPAGDSVGRAQEKSHD